jgi:ribA/ribD-fused uncharacterized protein
MTVKFYDPKAPFYEFSNFFISFFTLDGQTWPTVEHYFQASKFPSTPYVEVIKAANTPYKAFILAQQIKKGGYIGKWVLNKTDNRTLNTLIDENNHFSLRSDWEEVKLQVMEEAVYAKFSQNQNLKKLLLSTGDEEIVENSPRDSFWGVGKDGKGHNHLGKILMKVRARLNTPI